MHFCYFHLFLISAKMPFSILVLPGTKTIDLRVISSDSSSCRKFYCQGKKELCMDYQGFSETLTAFSSFNKKNFSTLKAEQ